MHSSTFAPAGTTGAPTSLRWQVGGDTDIGGSSENQDDMFIWEKKELGLCVIGVLDGHGREVGKLAAVSAKCFLVNFFEKYYQDLFSMPYECLARAHLEAHLHVKDAFKSYFQHHGWEVLEYKNYLIKRRRAGTGGGPVSSGWQCVHGGTSCSIVAVVGDLLYIANVGDSSGTLSFANCSKVLENDKSDPTVKVDPVSMNQFTDLIFVGDSDSQSIKNTRSYENKAVMECSDMSVSTSSVMTDVESVNSSGILQPASLGQNLTPNSSTVFTTVMNHSQVRVGGHAEEALRKHNAKLSKVSPHHLPPAADHLVVTAEHSPESPEEYLRLCSFHCLENSQLPTPTTMDGSNIVSPVYSFGECADPPSPGLLVVYDESNCQDKSKCPNIFCVEGAEKQLKVTNNGRYYKNVRKEWASLVATPRTAKFHDALAFTRSLGDFHLHTYGVSQYPEVQCVDLGVLLNRAKLAGSVPVFCLVLATDGVWDNWTYEDVTKFVMDASCLQAVLTATTPNGGAARVSHSFLHRNMIHSNRNFGNQADNATGIVLYLSADVEFPAK